MSGRRVAVLAAVGAAITAGLAWEIHTSPVIPDGIPAMVVSACHADAARRLVLPATASFGQETSYPTGDGYWHLFGVIDSRDASGTSTSVQYTCDAEPYDGRWITSVTVGQMPASPARG